jgi:transposase
MKLTTANIVLFRYLLFEQHLLLDAIAARFNVTDRTVRRWRRKYQLFGDPYTPRSVAQGRPRLLTDAQRDVCESTYLLGLY